MVQRHVARMGCTVRMGRGLVESPRLAAWGRSSRKPDWLQQLGLLRSPAGASSLATGDRVVLPSRNLPARLGESSDRLLRLDSSNRQLG
jgi:hypothetical protein